MLFILFWQTGSAETVSILDSELKSVLLTCADCATIVNGTTGVIDKNQNGKVEVSEAETINKVKLKGKSLIKMYNLKI